MKPNSKHRNKILILTSTFPRWENDTVTTFVFDFAKQMKKKGWEPVVLAPHYPGAEKKEEMDGITVKRFQYWFTKNGQNIVYNGGAVQNLKKTPLYGIKVGTYAFVMLAVGMFTAVKQRASIVNPHWLIPQGFLAIIIKYLTRKKVVVTVHGGDVFSLNGLLMRFIKRWTLKRADEVVVNSSTTLAAAQSLYGDREYHVIPMGIDTDLFSPSESGEKQSDGLNVLFVGRLSEQKGVMYLCQSIKELIDEDYTNIELIVAGSGPEQSKIESFIADNQLGDYIKMVGWVNPDELPSYYRKTDVFVGPSIVSGDGEQEAFGLVFAESLATGTPVIATRGGVKDIVIDGENGFLITDKSSSAITDRLKLVLNDRKLLDRMQTNARERIVNNFSWSVIADKYSRVFDNVNSRNKV